MSPDKLKQKWAKQEEEEIEAAIIALLDNAFGRRLLWWLLRIGRVGMQPYSGNALNTAFACGELNIGQQVLERILASSPQGYILMMTENEDERRSRDTALADAYSGNTADSDADPESSE